MTTIKNYLSVQMYMARIISHEIRYREIFQNKIFLARNICDLQYTAYMYMYIEPHAYIVEILCE